MRYRPRHPRQSVLDRCVQEHVETRLAHCREGHDDDDSRVIGLYGFGAAAHILAQIARAEGRTIFAFTK